MLVDIVDVMFLPGEAVGEQHGVVRIKQVGTMDGEDESHYTHMPANKALELALMIIRAIPESKQDVG